MLRKSLFASKSDFVGIGKVRQDRHEVDQSMERLVQQTVAVNLREVKKEPLRSDFATFPSIRSPIDLDELEHEISCGIRYPQVVSDCILCGESMELLWINLSERIPMCSNLNCVYTSDEQFIQSQTPERTV